MTALRRPRRPAERRSCSSSGDALSASKSGGPDRPSGRSGPPLAFGTSSRSTRAVRAGQVRTMPGCRVRRRRQQPPEFRRRSGHRSASNACSSHAFLHNRLTSTAAAAFPVARIASRLSTASVLRVWSCLCPSSVPIPASSPRSRRRRTMASARRRQARHDGAALHRHAGCQARARASVLAAERGLRPLRGDGRRPHRAVRAGVAARLACRHVILGRRDRHQFLLDRHRDRQSRPRLRLSGLSRAARSRR